jgi:hypothetical protein
MVVIRMAALTVGAGCCQLVVDGLVLIVGSSGWVVVIRKASDVAVTNNRIW